MNSFCILGCLVSMVTVSHAWFFFGRSEAQIEPHTEIDQACLDTSDSCQMYDCVQRRFPCLPHSFALDHGQAYCLRYRDHLDQFNEEGRIWVRRSQACMAETMLDLYRLQSTTCQALNREGWDRMSSCYVREGFCNIAWDNREALWRVFQAHDLAHTLRVWREILEITVQCTGQQLSHFAQWGMRKIIDYRQK